MSKLPLARKDKIVIKELRDETLVYDLKTDKAYCLNKPAALVWKSCDGKTTAVDIATALGTELGAPVPEDLVLLAINELRRDGLLERQYELTPRAKTISRRDVVRRIGVTTAVALPIVASLVIPKVAMAASCACSNPGDCLVQSACPSSVNCNSSNFCAP
jgi:hypothetical protein